MCRRWNDLFVGLKTCFEGRKKRSKERDSMGAIYEDTTLQKGWNRWTWINQNSLSIGANWHIHLVRFRWRRFTYDRLVSETTRRSKVKRNAGPSEERGSISWIHPWVLRVWKKLQTCAWTGEIAFLWWHPDDCPRLLFLHLENKSKELWGTNL